MRQLAVLLLALLVAFGGLMNSAMASPDPEEALPDPVQEARAKEISQNLRCVVCKSQSINESNAPLAKDLRLLVRERVAAGDSDEEVMAYITDRYGEYVLLRPNAEGVNLFLWGAPTLMLLIGIALAIFFIRQQRKVVLETPTPLSEEEKALLEKAMVESDAGVAQKPDQETQEKAVKKLPDSF